jgi:hypothetical protein
VTDASWSRCGGEACVRVRDLAAGAALDVRVRSRSGAPAVAGELPAMAGRLVRDGDDTCFVPRFSFVEGTAYVVLVDGEAAAVLDRPRVDRPPTTEVLAVLPTAAVVPRNLLRFAVLFSAPMSEGGAADHVALVDEAGDVLAAARLPTEHELWDAERRRLTVLLDPARIKRGLAAHRAVGYPLRSGSRFRFVVDAGFLDAAGAPLVATAERCYSVGDDERRHVDPAGWRLTVPAAGTVAPMVVAFDRPLDHALLVRCLRVRDPDGRPVDGVVTVGVEERSWQVVPRGPWVDGPHQLVVDAELEDLAGNSVSRVFDRDLTRPDDDPRAARPVTLPFHPR